MTRPDDISATAKHREDEIRYRIVRRLKTADIVRLYRAGGWWKESRAWRAAIPSMIRGSFCFMIAVTRAGEVVGMGRAISDGVSDAYIQDVAGVKKLRGRGIGAELIRRLTRYLESRGIGWIGLVAEPGTRRFYERLGYGRLKGHEPMLFGKRP